ncbi:MAG: hypothetical protein R2752_04360 [Vicinamibacterales bacterium]
MVPCALAVLGVVGVSVLLGATIYEAVVMAPNYRRDVPESLELARRFFVRTTPAHFFRVATPLTQAVLLVGGIASWTVASARWPLLAALGVLVLTDVITFTFHYPRLATMFREPMPADPAPLRRAAREWAAGNLVRAALLVVALVAALRAVATLMIRLGA